jgi:nucleotide-binding universal stress UspA family protein
MKKPIYLVPVDFSPVSLEAVRTALNLAKRNNGSVLAIHVVAKKSEREEARTQFSQIIQKLTAEEQASIETKVLVGGIYEDIAKAAEIIGASLIVMGTHGAKGMQKLFGSHALRLVSSTGVPFVILQEGGSLTDIKTIVMPFNFEKESIQIANFAGFIAKQFNSTIHLVGYHEKDEWLNGKSRSNQTVVRRLFEEHQVNYEIVNIDKSKLYIDALLEYTEQVKADLIATSFFVDTMLPTMNSFVQALIENDRQIPILTSNAEELSISSNFSFMTI